LGGAEAFFPLVRLRFGDAQIEVGGRFEAIVIVVARTLSAS